MFSALLPRIPIESSIISIINLLNLLLIKIRRHPKALLLLVLTRIIVKYIRDT